MLDQMQRMASERANLERKFAKELKKFSSKWEERMTKVGVGGLIAIGHPWELIESTPCSRLSQ